jgi:lipid-binding SYLF domain-containing protein
MNLEKVKWAALPLAVFLALAPALAGPARATAQSASVQSADQVKKVEDAIRALDEMMKESDKCIPAGLIRDCAGIAIIPDVIKAGFVVGGRFGSGVVLVRTKDGWSDPSFIDIKGGSIGWQAGVQSADVILVFKTPRSVENITKGKFTLGADIGIAAGPLGRTAEASTDAQLKAEILSYSRSRGLYAGLSFQGSSIQEDAKANGLFYGGAVKVKDILEGRVPMTPEVARKLKTELEKYSK